MWWTITGVIHYLLVYNRKEFHEISCKIGQNFTLTKHIFCISGHIQYIQYSQPILAGVISVCRRSEIKIEVFFSCQGYKFEINSMSEGKIINSQPGFVLMSG